MSFNFKVQCSLKVYNAKVHDRKQEREKALTPGLVLFNFIQNLFFILKRLLPKRRKTSYNYEGSESAVVWTHMHEAISLDSIGAKKP